MATFGQPLTYKLIADNSGPDAATDVKVTDTPQMLMRLVSVKRAQAAAAATRSRSSARSDNCKPAPRGR